jgi:choline dehydrogenase-like flavoprotein
MQIENLSSLRQDTIEVDLAIVGGGPAGLTLAREFFGTSTRVLVIESGILKEESNFNALNAVESVGEPQGGARVSKRIAFHGANSGSWSHDVQRYGVRCRLLGGSSYAWAGKSASFDDIDFAVRAWVPYSGWPFDRRVLAPFLDRAADILNLGPNCYDEELWDRIGITPPSPPLNRRLLEAFFWQFARSRIDSFDAMRFGPDFVRLDAPNVRILLNATVTRIDPAGPDDARLGINISAIEGARSRVTARCVVLAASGIENPRILLVSNNVHPNGLGNDHDVVGRYLMDHPGATLGHFDAKAGAVIANRFGFYGVKHRGRTHMYMHGLVLSKELQEREELLQCAAYMMEQRAPDDPWDALKRLLRATTRAPMSDIAAVASSPRLLAKGLGLRALKSGQMPAFLREFVTDRATRLSPSFVAREFQSHGLPHKLTGVTMDGISEQRPNPESRITLSDKLDALGIPLARVDWRFDREASRSLVRLGKLVEAELARIGLPVPVVEDWIADDRPEDSVTIDMGHTFGTTRMSDDPTLGVTNSSCGVHGVRGLYVAGSSVFPTS